MSDLRELLPVVDRLTTAEKWQLVRYILLTLEHDLSTHGSESDFHQSLRESYGSLADHPIERAPQPPLEERDPID